MQRATNMKKVLVMNPKHFSLSFVWWNKKLHNYLKESQKMSYEITATRPSANCHRIFPITFDDFHIFGNFLHFTLTVLRVLSRHLLILRARHSLYVTIKPAMSLTKKTASLLVTVLRVLSRHLLVLRARHS